MDILTKDLAMREVPYDSEQYQPVSYTHLDVYKRQAPMY